MKILIIEDDKFFREFYSEKLRENNFEVDTAEDGEVGLSRVAAFKPDCILLDLIMPKKDGFDVLQTISADPQTSNIPVLVFSTLGQEKDIDKAIQLGAKGYTNKSFYDIDQLLKQILQITVK